MKWRAAIIGLGQAGSRFDEEPRGAIWSHAGAYLSLPRVYSLVVGVDPDAGNRERFARRCPTATVAESVSALGTLDIDVVSIATPAPIRLPVFEALLGSRRPPKVIICEKPLAADAAIRRRLVEMCEAANVTLLVHYNRRYTRIYQRFAAALADGMIGDLASLTVRAPNRLWSMGSHAIDMLLYLAREAPVDWGVMPLPGLTERGEPAGDLLCTFPSGAAGRVLTQGLSRVLIFEVDAVGSRGRLLARGYGERLDFIALENSPRYMGYLEPSSPRLLYRTRPNESAFVEIVKEAARLAGGGTGATCTGRMALASEELLDQVVAIAEGKQA